ncbi:hypothetical protein BN7_2450 [Wickerhamomyces ciferrii]|uniref:Uncharacterized protein n=1 Tax=Wickerhamomyces ciferrii (strain ATCC 14091 / BCRC 22168 / CBS 111 / JCM 3599 / NBRC 0793 / NRRL Y-1031 F-60-10) TaxID=1206466 RepID=K0KNE0_WICCF|nr:uncharacterized protein BN7_2450 [Wickerhamomyces ciferrii]CCH42904.1 hypothetical protein BN7_2450 [Wickerhamomyces ciferrii]
MSTLIKTFEEYEKIIEEVDGEIYINFIYNDLYGKEKELGERFEKFAAEYSNSDDISCYRAYLGDFKPFGYDWGSVPVSSQLGNVNINESSLIATYVDHGVRLVYKTSCDDEIEDFFNQCG